MPTSKPDALWLFSIMRKESALAPGRDTMRETRRRRLAKASEITEASQWY